MILNKKSRQSGFTLIELLAVVAILGILAGIGIPRIFGALENARVGADRANVAMLQSAVEQWGVIHNPGGTLGGWGPLFTPTPTAALTGQNIVPATDNLTPQFINAIPLAPSGTRTETIDIANPGYGLSLVSTGTAPNVIWTVTVVRIRPGSNTVLTP